MEYVQMTIDDWLEAKESLRKELQSVKSSFVRIGYYLRRIDDGKEYEREGYKSVAEFARAEYGLEASTTSRFMAINREYSVDGYSLTLREEYAGLGRSQLEEMLKLPDKDRAMIEPDTAREDIRELKRFNKESQGDDSELIEVVKEFYKANRDALNDLYSALEVRGLSDGSEISEYVNPSGSRSFKKGMWFLMMHEDRIDIKHFGGSPETMSWAEFYILTISIFGDGNGKRTWEEYYGEEDEGKDAVPEDSADSGRQQQAGTGIQEGADGPAEADDGPEDDADDEEGPEDHRDGGSDGEGTECADDSSLPLEDGERTPGIAPAQIEPEGVPQVEDEESEKAAVEADAPEEEEPPEAAVEVVDKPCGTRKEYIDHLSILNAAAYIVGAYTRGELQNGELWKVGLMMEWLGATVNEHGKEIIS